MKYLYGDSSPAPFRFDYLELVRESLEFAAGVLSAEVRLRQAHEQARALMSASDMETSYLEGQLAHAPDLMEIEMDRARRALDDAILELENDAATERGAAAKALEHMLRRRALPGTRALIRFSVTRRRYFVRVAETSPSLGLSTLIELNLPPGHLFGHVLRLEELVPRMAISFPEESGWLRKEMRPRPQQLEKLFVTALLDGRLSLRKNGDGSGPGFDLTAHDDRVEVTRAGSEGAPFRLSEDDARKVRGLLGAIELALVDVAQSPHSRASLIEARLDGVPFKEHTQPRVLVERLIEDLRPNIDEIVRRSPSRSGLLLKKQHDSGRREEIFLSIAELKAAVSRVRPAQHILIDALGLSEQASEASGLYPLALVALQPELERHRHAHRVNVSDLVIALDDYASS